jgi:hypothetical protein
LRSRRGRDRTAQQRNQQDYVQMASANDMKAAEKTYGGFITLLKWTVPITALIALFVILIIS